jgi:MFS family permease
LVVIALAQLMVALPSAQDALGFRDSDRQWVITAYTLSFAGLLLLGGRIADHVARRRALIGLAGFAAAIGWACVLLIAVAGAAIVMIRSPRPHPNP